MSYIKQLIEKYQKSAKRTIAGGLVALGVLTGSLTSCGNTNNTVDVDDTKDYIETVDNTKVTESGTATKPTETGVSDQTDKSTQSSQTDKSTETSNTTKPTESDTARPEDKFAHSATYNRAKQKWSSIWNSVSPNWDTEQGFLAKAAPFKFLAQQGVVYYNSEGEPRAYGTDENFDNILSIQTKAWIDPNTVENDFYLLTQYISEPIVDGSSNDDTYVATYMLKYTIDDACYRDLLLLSGDFRSNLLIQQIDQEYTPEVISKSVIKYDLIQSLELFKDLPNSGVYQSTLNHYKDDVSNYVSNIDYTNLTITVNYNSKTNKGDIYSYTYKLKETPNWDQSLQGSIVADPIPQEERDALTTEQLMPTYSSKAGDVLYNTSIFGWRLKPSADQKATASIKYEFDYLVTDVTGKQKVIDNYESGKISYEQVNDLTRDYVNSLKSGLTK